MVAHIVGAMLGTWLIAAIIQFPLRKLLGLSDVPAYAIGFAVAAPIASILFAYGNDHMRLGLFDMLPMYAIGAALGFVAVFGLFKLPSRKKP